MQDEAVIAVHRSQAYWLLSELMCEPPTRALLEKVIGDSESGEELEFDGELKALRHTAREALESPDGLSALRVEFTRLFGGLSKQDGLPPIESAVREGRVLGECASSVALAYAEAGFPQPYPEAGPIDHIATELRFLALACFSEADARRAGDEAAGHRWLQRERRFLDQHVLSWIPAYCASAAERAAEPFYRVLLHLIGTISMADAADVAALIEASPAPHTQRTAA